MVSRRWLRALGALVGTLIVATDISPAGRHLLRLPSVVTVAVGQTQSLLLDAPGRIALRAGPGAAALQVDGHPATADWQLLPGHALRLLPVAPGTYALRVRLFGVLPWRGLRVVALPVPDLRPGGQAIGILLRSRGPLVVAERAVPGAHGLVGSPAGAAGIRPGDVLLAVGERPVHTPGDIATALAAAGAGAVPMEVLRDGRTLHLQVHPVRDPASGRPLVGAWVRAVTGGIGTLTFTAATGTFGALGHVVVDPTTGTPVILGSGTLVPSVISGLEPSRDGHPGLKVGVLLADAPALGTVLANSPLGVFGQLLRAPDPGPVRTALPVALPDQIHAGSAQILTVVRGRAVVAYAARITAVLPQGRAAGRGFVVRITDPGLRAATGGIVQGMSGSPVLQDGRLVGAVTAVFVDDPSRGYGVLAIWMAQAAGLLRGALPV